MYDPKTLKDSRSAISLQASAGGQRQLDLLDGMTTDLCGREARPASHSVQPVTEKDKTTFDTSGPSSSISSASADLQWSLENRLRQRLEQAGSTIYKLTWKQKATPQQWSYSQRAASVPRTKENDSGQLQSAWPTPMTADNRDRGSFDDPSVQRRMSIGKSIELSMLAHVVTSGPEANTYTAETGKTVKYQLNPRFSLWLMGYPIEWAYCGERVTPLSRKSQRKL
jgi:hypothetical protein